MYELILIKRNGSLFIEYYPTKRPVMYGYGYIDYTLKNWQKTKVTIEVAKECQDYLYNVITWMYNSTNNYCNFSLVVKEELAKGISIQHLEDKIVIKETNDDSGMVNVVVKKAYFQMTEAEMLEDKTPGKLFLAVVTDDDGNTQTINVKSESFSDAEKMLLLHPQVLSIKQITAIN